MSVFSDPKVERNIYLIGNPFAVWMTSAGIVAFIVLGVSYFHLKHFLALPRSYGRSLGIARFSCFVCRILTAFAITNPSVAVLV